MANTKVSKITVASEPRQIPIQSMRVVRVKNSDDTFSDKTIINGQYWQLGIVPEEHQFVTVQDFFLNDEKGVATNKKVTNVLSTSAREKAMSLEDKIKTVTSTDASYAQALAFLLK